MTGDRVPLIDIAPWRNGGADGRRAVARAVDAACRDTGFFTVAGHGVPEALVAETRAASAAFFALPEDEKLASAPPPERKLPRGFSPLGNRSLSYTREVEAPPDLQESFAVGPVAPRKTGAGDNAIVQGFHAANIWPARPAGFEATVSEYVAAMGGLAGTIMSIFAAALGIGEDFFDDKIDRDPSVLRLTHYPAQEKPPLPGQLRSGEHTDYGSLTILRGDDVPGGLQVRRRDGSWTDLHPAPGSFVCNLGDMMMRWTNDYWVSTPHRVVNPPREFAGLDRISLVFFHMPNHDAEIACIDRRLAPGEAPNYSPINCADYFAAKYLRSEVQELDVDTASGTAGAGRGG